MHSGNLENVRGKFLTASIVFLGVVLTSKRVVSGRWLLLLLMLLLLLCHCWACHYFVRKYACMSCSWWRRQCFCIPFLADSNPWCSTRPQRFKPPLKVRGKSLAEFTNVLKSFQAALRQVRGKSFAQFTKAAKSFEEPLRRCVENSSQIPLLLLVLLLYRSAWWVVGDCCYCCCCYSYWCYCCYCRFLSKQ